MHSQRPNHNYPAHVEIINAAWSENKIKLRSILTSKTVHEETLYQAIKQMISKKNKSLLAWEIIQLIIDDHRFNPNYHNENFLSVRRVSHENIFCYTADSHLIKVAIREKCFDSMNLILNHPKMDFEILKNDYFKIIIESNKFSIVNCLLKNEHFFASEHDWLAWAKANIHSDHVKKLFAVNLCWLKWKIFTPELLDQDLCQDVINLIATKLHLVSLFANKEAPSKTDNTGISYKRGLGG